MQLSDGNNIKDIDETGYKYLGIIEGEEIKDQEMKKIKKEDMKRLKAKLKSKLSCGNTVKAINTWAVPVIMYSAGIVNWKNSTQQYGQQDQKSTNMYQALHPRSNVGRLYLPRSEGGKDQLSLEGCVNAKMMSLGQFLKMNEDEWLRSTREEGLIIEDEDPLIYREKTSKSRMEEWQSKPIHGQFLRQTKDLSTN